MPAKFLVLFLACCAPMVARAQAPFEADAANARLVISMNALLLPTTRAELGTMRGKIAVDWARPEETAVNVEADVASLRAPGESVRSYLMGPRIFDASRFPRLVFTSIALTNISNRRASLTGQLTLRGVTRSITLDVEQSPDDQTLTISGKLNRLDFGIDVAYPLVTSEIDVSMTARAAR